MESTWTATEKVVDSLSDDEIAKQWEYNVEDPRTPKLKQPFTNESSANGTDE